MSAPDSDARFSTCGRYRYWLSRRWDTGRPLAAFVMLNPSTADATIDDPTIRCCVRLAKREGFGGIRVVNLFAYRTPNRKELAAVPDPIGPENDRHIRAAARNTSVSILAWGGYVPDPDRVQAVLKLLKRARIRLKCIEMIGPAGNRQPRHPLYLRATATLVDFP
jgi:hypothetical protein